MKFSTKGVCRKPIWMMFWPRLRRIEISSFNQAGPISVCLTGTCAKRLQFSFNASPKVPSKQVFRPQPHPVKVTN